MDVVSKLPKEEGSISKRKLALYHFHEVPAHVQDNKHIHTGYRAFYSSSECLRSIFCIHNETGNIWTHLIGILIFPVILVFVYGIMPQHANMWDFLIIGVFGIAVTICVLFSALFHTMLAHEEVSTHHNFLILDYVGIGIVLYGAFLSLLYYALYLFHSLRITYVVLFTLISIPNFLMPWFPFFKAHPRKRTLYLVIYCIISCAICGHVVYVIGFEAIKQMPNAAILCLEVLFGIIGLTVYLKQVPESIFPGKFDHWFHSHQIWHFLVLVNGILHFIYTFGLMQSVARNNELFVSALS